MDIQDGFLRRTRLPATRLNQDCRRPSSRSGGRATREETSHRACTSLPCRLISLSPKNGIQISWMGLAAVLDLISFHRCVCWGCPLLVHLACVQIWGITAFKKLVLAF